MGTVNPRGKPCKPGDAPGLLHPVCRRQSIAVAARRLDQKVADHRFQAAYVLTTVRKIERKNQQEGARQRRRRDACRCARAATTHGWSQRFDELRKGADIGFDWDKSTLWG